jgi:zinc protease
MGFLAFVKPPQTKRLANGLTVILQEDRRLPLVSMELRYDVGERAAPEKSRGLAALTFFLMQSGTVHAPGDAYRRLLWRAGATFDDTTTIDACILDATLPANRMELLLWLWSDQMGFFAPALDAARLAERRSALAEQRRNALEGPPLARLDDFGNYELYPESHPYHGTRIGTPETVLGLDRAAVLAFHDRWMTPDHATLVVVGDLRAEEAFAQVERYFGPIPPSATRARIEPTVLPRLAGETQLDVAARTQAASVVIRWPTPRYMTTDDAGLDIVAALLDGRRTNLLQWFLIDQQKVARSVRASQRSYSLASEFEVYIEGIPGKTAPELLAAFDTAMDQVRSRTVDATTLEHAVYEATIGRVYAVEATKNRSANFAKFQTLVGKPEYFRDDIRRFTGTTIADIPDLIARYLPRDRRLVFLNTPNPKAAPGGEITHRRFVAAGAP